MSPPPSIDPLSDLRELTRYAFMVNAFEATAVVAVLAGVVGWYVVLRRQTFVGHTLSVMAFPGAAAGALLGLPGALGYYAACLLTALAVPRGDRGASGESAAVGTVQAAGLALGFLLLSLSHGVFDDLETLLFGSYLGVTRAQVLTLLLVAAAVLALLAAIGRPLLLATLDSQVARARGVPVARLDLVFILLLALAVAATSQITGALLVFALLVAPPATAQVLTARPVAGLVLSVALALAISWLSLAIAYYSPYPASFFATSIAFALYLLARVARRR